MKYLLIILGLVFNISIVHSQQISLTPGNPRFLYSAALDGEDPRANLADLIYSADYKSYVNMGQQGSLTYKFEVAAGASSLRIQTCGYTRNNELSGVQGTYSVDGGAKKILFNTGRSVRDGTKIEPTGLLDFKNDKDVQFVSDGSIELDPLKKHTVTLTITSNGYGDWNEQILKGDGQLLDQDGDPQSLIVTAQFKKSGE